MSETRTMPIDEVNLFGEMRSDLKRIDATLVKMNGHIEFWLPKWEQQTHGLMTLENKQAATENHLEKLRDFLIAEIAKFRAEITAKETAEEKLELLAKAAQCQREEYEAAAKQEREEARKERRDTTRWIVGMIIGGFGLTIAAGGFLIQHATFK